MPNPAIDPQEVAQLDEAAWYERAYRGDVPQLTARAVVTGLGLGFVLSLANVYIGLVTGWFFGMAIAAALASFGLWRLARRPLSLLETNCMQSTASSAAYATGNMVVGVIPALLLMNGSQPAWWAIAAWIACIAGLGVVLAVPLKRRLINREPLAFPSGTAAAILLHGLHTGAAVGVRVRVLVGGLVAGALLPILRGAGLIAGGTQLVDGLVLDHSLLAAAAGVFAGLRTTAWMAIGGLVTTYLIGPIAVDAGAASSLGTAWLECGIWIGAPFLVAYAVVALAGDARIALRAFRGARAADNAIELPRRWFWLGFAALGALAIVLGQLLWDIPIALGALAVALSLAFSAVACRVTGETDITPGAPMGKLTQLGFGALRPHAPSTNLMTAAMTHASTVAAADLLNDLKCGYLLGANPRKQFVAQAIGIAAGTAGSVLAYFILVPDASALAPGHFAAPGAHQFQAIALLLQDGFAKLHPLHRTLVVVGGGAGFVVSIVGRFMPRRVSAAGLGLGLLLPLSTSIAMLLGASASAIANARVRDGNARFTWPLAAGALAGESLAGVAVALAHALSGR